MRRLALPLLALVVPLSGCIQSTDKYPSLLPRAIESQSTAEPEQVTPTVGADPALDTRIAGLSARVDAAQAVFTRAAQETEAKIAVARGLPEGSDPWLNAQVSLGGLDVVHSQITDVLTDIEQLEIERGTSGALPYPALKALLDRATALSEGQTKRIQSLEAALAH